ncbi:unnamed protein product [Meloidogyne enterolobii]|uniref:Uncharacterized protein n=1 Tax=Meloidogyne enterolobii TaxID=390850 RepID=A0ACB1AFF0_MELEN
MFKKPFKQNLPKYFSRILSFTPPAQKNKSKGTPTFLLPINFLFKSFTLESGIIFSSNNSTIFSGNSISLFL